MECAAGARCENQRVVFPGWLSRQRFTRPPRLHHLVIVPQRHSRYRGVEGAQIAVKQIVFVVAAVIGNRLGGLRFLFGDDAAPYRAVGELLLRRDRTVGIDIVAAVDEEIRRIAVHGGVAAHATARHVDAPALAHRVAGPQERNRAPVGGRRAETPDLRLVEHRARQALEADAVENILARRQRVEQRFGGEVRFRQSVDEDAVPDLAKRVGGGDLDQHARGPVGACPDHAGASADVAGLHAMGDLRPVRCEAQAGACDAADRRAGRRRGSSLQQRAPRDGRALPYLDGHWASAVETRRKVASDSDEGSNFMRRPDDSIVALCRTPIEGTAGSAAGYAAAALLPECSPVWSRIAVRRAAMAKRS
jgi:hypothetical protein